MNRSPLLLAASLLVHGQSAPPVVYKAGNGVTIPTAISRPVESTTPVGIKLRALGYVYLSLVVQPDGTTTDIKVTGPLGYGLDEQAVDGVRNWRFQPGMKDGVPVPVSFGMGHGFRMCPENPAKTWCSGPMSFAHQPGENPPVVVDGTMPGPLAEPMNDSAIFEFTVDAQGGVKDIRQIEGSPAAQELLPAYLSTWKFRPASRNSQQVEATGRVRFIIGNGKGWNASTPPPPARSAPQTTTTSTPRTMVNDKDGQTYVWIPPGSFTMGCSDGDSECFGNERPPHPAKVGAGFWLGRTLVTQAAWAKVMGGNPSRLKGDELPVETVTWNDASNYCRAIGGRLPSDVEFEYAARAGSRWSRYGNIDDVAWYKGNSGNTTHPVGTKQPNAFGLFDMLGNLWEWIEDDYPGGRLKINRGGSAFSDIQHERVSRRGNRPPTEVSNALGFRCAISASDPNAQPVSSNAPSGAPPAPDAEAWQIARDSNSPDLLEQFLKEYPNSPYGGAARLELAVLRKSGASRQPPPPKEEAVGPVYSAGAGVTAPKPSYQVKAEYSEQAKTAKLSGAVVLSVVVTPEGKAVDIQVVTALGMGLDEKAIECVKKWKFEPGTKDGKPVNVRATIEVGFHLL